MSDVVCFGEVLIDFVSTQRDVEVGDAPSFVKLPGGAPANVAVGLAKLGVPTAFMGQVGEDFFGHYLARVLAENGVDVTALRFSTQAMTPLAFVSVTASGERSFVFYRKPSADMLMTPADLDRAKLETCQIYHYGSISLINEPLRTTTLEALRLARASGALISYDPNLRLFLWPSAEAAREGLWLGMEEAEVVKISDEEVFFLTGETDVDLALKRLWRPMTRLIVVTRGAAGCVAYTPESRFEAGGFAVPVEDTVGAGDGFVAGLLAGLLEQGRVFTGDLTPLLRRANAVGALTVSRQGAIPALPTRAELDAFLAAQAQG